MDTYLLSGTPFPTANKMSERLMISGQISTGEGKASLVEVQRGMRILTRDGKEAGKVAAVAFEPDSNQVAYILQCQLPHSPDYRKVSLDLIEQVSEDTVRLRLTANDVANLPTWRSNEI